MRTTLDAFAPAACMLQALKAREVSAMELLEGHLRRIARYNPALNAIVTVDYVAARRAAAVADTVRARKENRVLLGLPMTVKDTIDVQGWRGTAGLPQSAERRPESDARVVARLQAAGGVIMGKTNVPFNAGDWQSTNPVFGRTNNPWDLGRTPGGSTGGGAAALAAGLTALEFGSDIAGSIRVPAAFCGVYGHKPSETALPRSGHFPGSPLPNAAVTMGVQGPLARSAGDLQIAFDVAAGPDAGEDAGWQLVIPPARHDRLADFRVALLPAIPWLPVDSEIIESIERLAAELCRLGTTVDFAQPEAFHDLRHYHQLYMSLFCVLTSAGAPEEVRRQRLAQAWPVDDEFDRAFAQGLWATAAEYLAWHAERELYRAAYRAFFRDWDILVTPITLSPAFLHTDVPGPERRIDVNGQPVPYTLQAVYPGIASLSGQPATVFPVGLTRAGRPIGLQAIGPYLEDNTPIRFTALLEEEFGGVCRPPGYDAGW